MAKNIKIDIFTLDMDGFKGQHDLISPRVICSMYYTTFSWQNTKYHIESFQFMASELFIQNKEQNVILGLMMSL